MTPPHPSVVILLNDWYSMKLYFDYYDSSFVDDKIDENSEIYSLFIVSKLIATYYVVTMPKFYIQKYSDRDVNI